MPALSFKSATRRPAEMSVEERFFEIAAILASGILRLRFCKPVSASSHQQSPSKEIVEPFSNSLDMEAERSLHVDKRQASHERQSK